MAELTQDLVRQATNKHYLPIAQPSKSEEIITQSSERWTSKSWTVTDIWEEEENTELLRSFYLTVKMHFFAQISWNRYCVSEAHLLFDLPSVLHTPNTAPWEKTCVVSDDLKYPLSIKEKWNEGCLQTRRTSFQISDMFVLGFVLFRDLVPGH